MELHLAMISSVLLLILGFGLPFGYYYLKKNPQFGGKLTKGEKLRLQQSEHWKKGVFQNLSKTTMDMRFATDSGKHARPKSKNPKRGNTDYTL